MFKSFARVLAAAATALASTFCATASAQDPVSLEVFALREVIQQVSLSPDGKYMALMKIDTREGDPIVEIYETDDLSKRPRRLSADPMEYTSLFWVSNELLGFTVRQRLYKRIQGFNQGVFANRVAAYNLRTQKFEDFGNADFERQLPDEDDVVLVSSGKALSRDDPFAAFRPRAYYKLNLRTGARSLIMKGNDKVATASFDAAGNPRSASGYDAVTKEFIFYGRAPGESRWNEVLRRDSFDYEDFTPSGFMKDDPSKGYVIATNGNDVYGLWEFDWENGEYGDLIFKDEAADVRRTINHPNTYDRPDEVIGFDYYGPKPQVVFFDKEVEAVYAQLSQVVPNAYNLSIRTMSKDGLKYIVFNVGPRDPGSYYLVNKGQISKIGSHAPIKPEQLADVEFVEYTSRDGRTIRGYITIPNVGEPPYPTVAMPHGGPFVGEMPDYDEWAQMMASRGYMVFQPQFMASRGWGQKHYIDFLGEGGFRMQDDKDDGMLYLVDRGLADVDRLAMYGWSYGGYASAVAATREDQIYQCVLPGAAVLDTQLQKKYNQQSTLEASDEFAERRYSGINPLDEVSKINVPMLLIHGDVDQRVPYEHFKRYMRAVERAGKKDMVQTLVLKEADHFYNTLYYRHQIKLYEGITRFLAEDCGPGGL